MYREQAVEIIERHIDNNIASGSLVGQALSMAIDALRAQLSREDATSDLISKTETVEHLRRVLDATVPITDYDEGYVDGVEVGISTVSTMPSAQPEHQEGHWIRTDCGLDVECKCSVCGYKDFVEPHDTYWFNRNFCPNCGADMRGEKNE
jgi:hypothetical protein